MPPFCQYRFDTAADVALCLKVFLAIIADEVEQRREKECVRENIVGDGVEPSRLVEQTRENECVRDCKD